MSTTIQIVPVTTCDITFGDVINLSTNNLNRFCSSIGINKVVQLNVTIHENTEQYVRTVEFTDSFYWGENEYAWFKIEGLRGGTDAYCENIESTDIDPGDPWWQIDFIREQNTLIEDINTKLDKSKALNRIWRFRRSAGQTATVTISYGLISAAVAELTGGILLFDDGAWDGNQWPVQSEAFLGFYFKPDMAIEEHNKKWAESCIAGMREELSELNNPPSQKRSWLQRLFRPS